MIGRNEIEYGIDNPRGEPFDFARFSVNMERYIAGSITLEEFNLKGIEEVISYFDAFYKKLDKGEVSFSEGPAILIINNFFNKEDFGPEIKIEGNENEIFKKLGKKMNSLADRLRNIKNDNIQDESHTTHPYNLKSVGDLVGKYSSLLEVIQSNVFKRYATQRETLYL